MASIKAVGGGRSATGDLERYLKQKEKTERTLISGKDCNAEKIAQSFYMTRVLHDKIDGRQHHQIIQSFKPGEVTPEQAHKVGQELANIEKFEGFQVAIVTHVDKEHIHNHLVINSVNLDTGKKFQLGKKDLQLVKDLSDGLCQEHGLSLIEKTRDSKYLSMSQHQMSLKNTSRQEELANILNSSLDKVQSREKFQEVLEQNNFSVDLESNRQRLTFIDLKLKEKNDKNISEGKKGVKYKFGERALNKNFDLKISKDVIFSSIEKNFLKDKITTKKLFKNMTREKVFEKAEQGKPIILFDDMYGERRYKGFAGESVKFSECIVMKEKKSIEIQENLSYADNSYAGFRRDHFYDKDIFEVVEKLEREGYKIKEMSDRTESFSDDLILEFAGREGYKIEKEEEKTILTKEDKIIEFTPDNTFMRQMMTEELARNTREKDREKHFKNIEMAERKKEIERDKKLNPEKYIKKEQKKTVSRDLSRGGR